MTRSQAEELLKQEVSVWPQTTSILLVQVRILSWRLSAAHHLQARKCQGHHFIGFSLHFSVSSTETWNVAVKSGVVIFSSWFGQVGCGWECRCGHHFLLIVSFFLLFQGKEGGFIVRDSSKAGKYTVSVFAKSTGWVLLFQGLGDKDRGTHPTAP